MKIAKIYYLFFFVYLISACSSAPEKSGSAQKNFQLRSIQEKTLSNGLRLMYIPDNTLPRITMAMMIMSGSAQDQKGREGLMNMTSGLLEQGTVSKTATQVADEFAQLGSAFSESVASDYILLSTAGLSVTKQRLAELFAEVILKPAFKDSEVERLRSQTLAQIAQMKDQPSSYAELLFDKEIYGQHPYGLPGLGSVESVKSLKRSHIVKNYFSFFRPNNAILVVTGNIDENDQAQVEKLFSSWQRKDIQSHQFPEVASPEKLEMKLVTKAGLQQTQIRMGYPAISRNHPDFLTIRLANVILGGAFASRLNQKVRDDLGLTYSISSKFDAMKSLGSFEISTFTRNDKVAETIKATLGVLRDFRASGVTEDELNAAKALLVGQFPAAIETVDRLALNLLLLRLNGVSDDYLKYFFTNVNGISKSQVDGIIQKYFTADKIKVLIYADESQVAEQLKSLGSYQVDKVQ